MKRTPKVASAESKNSLAIVFCLWRQTAFAWRLILKDLVFHRIVYEVEEEEGGDQYAKKQLAHLGANRFSVRFGQSNLPFEAFLDDEDHGAVEVVYSKDGAEQNTWRGPLEVFAASVHKKSAEVRH